MVSLPLVCEATAVHVDNRRDILPFSVVEFYACLAGSIAPLERSRQTRYNPLAITTPAPQHTRAVGSTCHTTRSMPMPQSKAVYSNGDTIEGGAERNASVSRYCPIAASSPIAMSHFQCTGSMLTQPGAARVPANTLIRPMDQKTTLTVVSVRVNTRTATALRA